MAKKLVMHPIGKRKPTTEQYQDGASYRTLISLLLKSGMNVWEARMKAREILGRKLKG